MKSSVIAAVLLSASSVGAQSVPVFPYGPLYTPEIHLGSATTPSTITEAPVVVVVRGQDAEPVISNAPPASTELLATRHFDFIVSSALELISPQGNMTDNSISLGEYSRQLRAQKQKKSAPGPAARPNSTDIH
jgi:hypothetical protein